MGDPELKLISEVGDLGLPLRPSFGHVKSQYIQHHACASKHRRKCNASLLARRALGKKTVEGLLRWVSKVPSFGHLESQYTPCLCIETSSQMRCIPIGAPRSRKKTVEDLLRLVSKVTAETITHASGRGCVGSSTCISRLLKLPLKLRSFRISVLLQGPARNVVKGESGVSVASPLQDTPSVDIPCKGS